MSLMNAKKRYYESHKEEINAKRRQQYSQNKTAKQMQSRKNDTVKRLMKQIEELIVINQTHAYNANELYEHFINARMSSRNRRAKKALTISKHFVSTNFHLFRSNTYDQLKALVKLKY